MANSTHTTNTALGTTRTHLNFPTSLLRDVDKLAGPRGRSEFVADAVAKEVQRLQVLDALKNVVGSLKDEDDVPAEWKTPEGTLKWVRDLRDESDRLRNV